MMHLSGLYLLTLQTESSLDPNIKYAHSFQYNLFQRKGTRETNVVLQNLANVRFETSSTQ